MEIEIVKTLMDYASVVMLVMFLLVAAVNIITEVMKRLMPKVPTDIVVVVLSIVLTVLSLFVYAQIREITVMWYYAVGAVVMGIFVSYSAMFGFDKFTEILDRLKDFKSLPTEEPDKRE